MSNLGNRCQFAGECSVFNGEEKISETPLPIFRNVFCNRGMRGWKNCVRFNELDHSQIKKTYNSL